MDEKKLSELFKDAVGDTPPPTFGTGEIRHASYRATVKRRNTVVAASALAFVLVAGGTVTAVALSGGIADTSAANAPANAGGAPRTGGTMYGEGSGSADGPSVMREQSPTLTPDRRSELPKQGGASTGNAGSAGSTPSGCQADRELAAALAGELPAAPGQAQAVPFGCLPGARGAAFTVTDGSKAGTVSVVLLPKDVQIFAPLGAEVPGTANAQSEAASGKQLHVVSQPDPNLHPADAPFADSIGKIAADIAPRF